MTTTRPATWLGFEYSEMSIAGGCAGEARRSLSMFSRVDMVEDVKWGFCGGKVNVSSTVLTVIFISGTTLWSAATSFQLAES